MKSITTNVLKKIAVQVFVCAYPDVLKVPTGLLNVHTAVKRHPAAPEEPDTQTVFRTSHNASLCPLKNTKHFHVIRLSVSFRLILTSAQAEDLTAPPAGSLGTCGTAAGNMKKAIVSVCEQVSAINQSEEFFLATFRFEDVFEVV